MVYADYEYYIEKYYGTLPQDSFYRFVLRASKEIDKNVNIRLTQEVIDRLKEEAQEQLKYVACALTDLIAKERKSEDTNLSSISIDGVSKSFKTISKEEFFEKKKDLINFLPNELTRFL